MLIRSFGQLKFWKNESYFSNVCLIIKMLIEIVFTGKTHAFLTITRRNFPKCNHFTLKKFLDELEKKSAVVRSYLNRIFFGPNFLVGVKELGKKGIVCIAYDRCNKQAINQASIIIDNTVWSVRQPYI